MGKFPTFAVTALAVAAIVQVPARATRRTTNP
jgi:hypothetical protein